MIYLFYALLALVVALFIVAVALAVEPIVAHVGRQRLYRTTVNHVKPVPIGGWAMSLIPTPVPALVARE